jgi:hypothetical protein
MDKYYLKWEECKLIIEKINPQYSIPIEQVKVIFEYVQKLDTGAEVVEVGIAHGRTGVAILLAGQGIGVHYTGIDNFTLGSTCGEVADLLSKFNSSFNIYACNSDQVKWEKPIDILIIDGGHYEAAVKADCEIYIPHIKPGGLVMFHDWDEPFNQQSAHWAIHFYGAKHTEGWEDLGMVGNLKIKRKPL